MPEKDPATWQFVAAHPLLRAGLALLIGLLAGAVNHLIAVRAGARFSWAKLVIEMLISGFAGLLGGLACLSAGLGFEFSLFFAGVLGQMGVLGLSLLDAAAPQFMAVLLARLRK